MNYYTGGRQLEAPPESTLPEGSTVWVYYQKYIGTETSMSAVEADTQVSSWDVAVLKPYKVLSTDGGYQSLYACGVTETVLDGVTESCINTETVGSPMYLPEGFYKFRIMSPALPLYNGTNTSTGAVYVNHVAIDNGMYLLSSDERYLETASTVQQVSVSGDKAVQYIQLNPMIHQTARLTFTLLKGDNVYDLQMLDSGIEIAGLQNPTQSGQTDYNWSSMSVADTLQMFIGDKRQRLTLKGDTIQERIDESGVDVIPETGGYAYNDAGMAGHSYLFAHTGVLPTNAESYSMVFLFNMMVNGIPTQQSLTLNGLIFSHFHSYNMRLKVNEKGDISVMPWQNQSWNWTP